MNQNSLMEFGSTADVVIRFNNNMNINGRQYKAGEPYLFLKNVNVLIQYDIEEKTASNRPHNILSTSNHSPTTISIGKVPFTRKLASLLATFEEVDSNFVKTKFVSLAASRNEGDVEGIIFLIDEIDANNNLFVYDSEFNQIEVEYDEAMNTLTSPEFNDGEEYLISFSSVERGTKFDLKQPCMSYLSLEIQGVGNVDKKTKSVLMSFEKVSLQSIINFTFIQDQIINIPLNFTVIKGKNMLYFED